MPKRSRECAAAGIISLSGFAMDGAPRTCHRSGVSRKPTTVQCVSRNKASVRWTLVPANAQAREGLGRCPSAAGSAQPQGLVPANARARRARAGTQAQQGKRSAGAERSKDFFSTLLV